MKLSISRLARMALVVLTAAVGFAPLAASAQTAGTNGVIFFNYLDTNKVQNIAAMNSDGTQSHLVVPGTDTNTYFTSFAFAPNGTKIAYTKTQYDSNGNATRGLYVSAVDGTNPVAIMTTSATDIFLGDISFSADSSTLYFGRSNSTTDATNGIYSVPVAGGSATQVIADSAGISNENSGFAVTANYIYFIKTVTSGSGSTPSTSLYRTSLTGTGATLISTLTLAGATVEDISASGSSVLLDGYVVSGSDTINNLYAVSTTPGSTAAAVTSNTLSSYNYASGSYSPDGTKLMYSSYTVDISAGTFTSNPVTVVNADGTGTATHFRADAGTPYYSSIANYAPGSYTTELPTGTITQSSQSGGGGDTTDATTLPDTGAPLKGTLPYALIALALTAVAGIEITSRVRSAKR